MNYLFQPLVIRHYWLVLSFPSLSLLVFLFSYSDHCQCTLMAMQWRLSSSKKSKIFFWGPQIYILYSPLRTWGCWLFHSSIIFSLIRNIRSWVLRVSYRCRQIAPLHLSGWLAYSFVPFSTNKCRYFGFSSVLIVKTTSERKKKEKEKYRMHPTRQI